MTSALPVVAKSPTSPAQQGSAACLRLRDAVLASGSDLLKGLGNRHELQLRCRSVGASGFSRVAAEEADRPAA
ncbi:hypothetical protein EHI47_19560 [Rhizobium leguminosarum]|uniref:Uncharacterized protein n=2 Tax=Rhizobium TaxID=379 RepID=A0A444HWK4_RHILE|nr:hypothetical protein EHI45_04720 [Rhizobium leguminosarum]RWX28332.1 hypothetical protein EHI47_19560 [Rhizobium leguminosarum]TAU44181.1 hypothetical protein ELI43_29790 [Rhizobium leguminosarum]TBC61002.1 hypothetical protein ELH27_31355 [Rhizobium leguminosarum]TBE60200.1 hypothetical protein ELH03_31590 [Rhizobium beringeri]